VAVRTGGEGAGGISLLLLERGMAGLETKQMKCMGVWPSGTTYITMDDVKVPVENLIGQENQGFKYIMCVRPRPARAARARARALARSRARRRARRRYNFNHERWALSIQASRFSRVCLEEAFKYAMKRSTFGKKLIEHPVIRLKIAEMARQVECTHAQLENITYQARAVCHARTTIAPSRSITHDDGAHAQMCKMNKKDAMEKLGGPTALLKVQTTKVFELCAREAAQIFGGLSYVRGGQGEKVERLYREVRAYASAPPTASVAEAGEASSPSLRSPQSPAARRRSCWTWRCGRR